MEMAHTNGSILSLPSICLMIDFYVGLLRDQNYTPSLSRNAPGQPCHPIYREWDRMPFDFMPIVDLYLFAAHQQLANNWPTNGALEMYSIATPLNNSNLLLVEGFFVCFGGPPPLTSPHPQLTLWKIQPRAQPILRATAFLAVGGCPPASAYRVLVDPCREATGQQVSALRS